MSSDDEGDLQLTPNLKIEQSESASEEILPSNSKIKYEKTFADFERWRIDNKIGSHSERVFLAYFREQSRKFAPNTLWVIYSMLKSTMNLKKGVDISKYSTLKSFLKRSETGYNPKKSNTLTTEQIREFLDTADDKLHLLTKVALIVGISGCCRKSELLKLETKNIEDLGDRYLVTLNDSKRTFLIPNSFYNIVKKYSELRPSGLENNRFFINYVKGRCTRQVVGINKLAAVPKNVATFLNLHNPENYTGHALRRSSATQLKRDSGWQSTTVTEGYIAKSVNNPAAAFKIASVVSNDATAETSTTVLEGLDLQTVDVHQSGDDINVRHGATTTAIAEGSGLIFQNCTIHNLNIYKQ